MSVEQHGGNFNPPANLLHPPALDYVVESVAGELFGEPLYPTLADKAAVYMFLLISNHVFSDGNKRTGLEAALLFLRLNGYTLPTDSKQYQGVINGYVYSFTSRLPPANTTLTLFARGSRKTSYFAHSA